MEILENTRKEYQGKEPCRESMKELCREFDCTGELLEVREVPEGRIHHSYVVTMQEGMQTRAYFFQKINTAVFTEPVHMLQNVMLVTQALAQKHPERDERHQLLYRMAKDGKSYVRREDGSFWRCCHYIDHAHTVESCAAEKGELYRVARAFGEFSADLSDMEMGGLTEALPHFHDIHERWNSFWKAVREDKLGRVRELTMELQRLQAADVWETVQMDGVAKKNLPHRVVHGDTKSSNVLLDISTGEVLTVIDLDTCMPGYLMEDFGDMVRSMAGRENDGGMKLDFEALCALTQGFGAAWKGKMTEEEKGSLAQGIRSITLELSLRYLTDYLQGDIYFTGGPKGQNLQRGRKWLALYDAILENIATINAIIREGLS